MIADRHMLVVRQQRIVRAEHAPDIRRVIHRRIEVRVVAHLRRQHHLHISHRDQRLRQYRLRLAIVRIQRRYKRRTEQRHRPAPQRHQRIERCMRARAHRQGQPFELRRRTGRGSMHVQHHVTNRDTDPRRVLRAGTPEHAERQVLYGEVGLRRVGARHPAGACRIVRRVHWSRQRCAGGIHSGRRAEGTTTATTTATPLTRRRGVSGETALSARSIEVQEKSA